MPNPFSVRLYNMKHDSENKPDALFVGFQVFDPVDTSIDSPHVILYLKHQDMEIYLKPDQAIEMGRMLVDSGKRMKKKRAKV